MASTLPKSFDHVEPTVESESPDRAERSVRDEPSDQDGGSARERRRDAQANHGRLVEGALRAIAREGLRVPVATIAAEAGVGVATFYRCFTDRDALMQELESRAYGELNRIIHGIESHGVTGLPAIHRFLLESLAICDRLVLPLHGAPPLVDPASTASRQRIDAGLQRFIDAGRRASAIATDVNATDIVMCSALISQPLRRGPNWERSARRHLAVFVSGLSTGRELPEPPVLQSDIERSFAGRAARADRIS